MIAYSYNEEDTADDGSWQGSKHLEERSRHGTDERETHQEVGNPLFDNRHGNGLLPPNLQPFRLLGMNDLYFVLAFGQSLGMDRRLHSISHA